MKTTVCLDAVCKSYDEGSGQRQVLQNLDFEAAAGEAVALLGASGSGKSTLLNLIAGLSVPDSGTVTVAGQRLDLLDEDSRTVFRRSQVGFVFQFFHLVPTLTVEENLRLPLQLNGRDTAVEKGRIAALLARVGLADRASVLPDRLSGGEQQRIAVCRSVLLRPPIVLADEPTGNLNEETAASVLDLLLELCGESSSTLLLVTHSREVAARCSRVERVVAGQLQRVTA